MNTDNVYKPVDLGIDPHAKPLSQQRNDEKLNELSCCISGLWHTLFCCCLPVTCCCNITTVKPMHDTIVTRCGVVNEVLRQPGPHCVGTCWTDTTEVYMGLETKEILKMQCSDDHGSPVIVSAQFVYRIQDSVAAMYRTNHLSKFIVDQAESALRAVVAMYPYDFDRHDEDNQHSLSLTKQSDKIDKKLAKVLQEMINFVGVKVETFRLITVGYDQRMEKILLARQEAQAAVTARRTIAEGTAGILQETLKRLKTLGINLNETERNRFATNLTMLLVNHGHTTINIFDGGNAQPAPEKESVKEKKDFTEKKPVVKIDGDDKKPVVRKDVDD